MNRASELRARLSMPVIVAPMFLISGVELVVACCKEGVVGTFPTLNGRTGDDFRRMLSEITEQLGASGGSPAPYGVNLIVHKTNSRLQEDLETCIEFKVPIIITSLGKPTEIVEAVHGYGGLVLSDVSTVEFAHKAAETGVDGLILVCVGAGGHAGTLNPFVFTSAVREFYDGIVAVSGCISNGRAVRACEVLGADFAYLGTRFIPTTECAATDAYKDMIVEAGASDIIHTPVVSGIPCNFIRASLERCGYDITKQGAVNPHADLAKEYSLWRDIWTAGQGVQTIHGITSVRDVVQSLRAEYQCA